MALAILYPNTQFFDNNGDPLAGGRVYTYVTGTSTPQTAYQDSAEASSHGAYVQLDSAGRALIYLGTEVSPYKFIVKDSAGATVTTMDPININIIGSNLSGIDISNSDILSATTLTASTGAAEISLQTTTGDIKLNPTGSGAVVIGNGANGPGRVRVLEDTDNGSNYIEVIAPASVASNKVQTLQDVTGTIICTGGTDLPVADGGTGVSSLTAYGPVIGGTTATGSLQAVSPASSIMQSLFSGGSSAIPAYSYAPKRTVVSSTGGAANLDATITDMLTLGGVNNLVMVHISVKPVTDGSSLYMRFFDSTTTIVTTNYAWQMIEVNGTTVTGAENTSDTKIDLTNGRGTGNSGNEILEGVIWITGASFNGTLRNYLATGAQQSITITGLNTQFFDGIRIYASAGNVSGSISVTNFPVGT